MVYGWSLVYRRVPWAVTELGWLVGSQGTSLGAPYTTVGVPGRPARALRSPFVERFVREVRGTMVGGLQDTSHWLEHSLHLTYRPLGPSGTHQACKHLQSHINSPPNPPPNGTRIDRRIGDRPHKNPPLSIQPSAHPPTPLMLPNAARDSRCASCSECSRRNLP